MLEALLSARYGMAVGRIAALPFLPAFAWFVFEVNRPARNPWVPFFLCWFLGGLCYSAAQRRYRGLEYLVRSASPLDAPLLAEFWSRVPPRDGELRSAIEAVLPSLVECDPDCLDDCPQAPPAGAINPRFIEQCKAARQAGDVLPPWVRSPGYPPWSVAWRQGNGEAWMNEAWRPFWQSLDDAAQREYASRWEADEEWREYLFEIWKR